MSRFSEWTSAERGLGNFAKKHIEIDVRGQKGKADKYYGVEMKKLIFKFAKVNKIKGSYTDCILEISDNHYKQWTEFIISLKTI